MPTQSSESIRFQCPGCQRTYRGPSRFLGKKLRCSGCQTEIYLTPAPAPLELTPLELAPTPPPRFTPPAARGPSKRRRRPRSRRESALLLQLHDAARMALVWGLLGLVFVVPAIVALRRAKTARALARRLRRPVPGRATVGRLLGWWVLGSLALTVSGIVLLIAGAALAA